MNVQNNCYLKDKDNVIGSDSQLFKEFQEGSIEAFAQLYDKYVNVLFNYGCKLINDRELLKDSIHDVFVKIYNKRGDLNNILDFKSYLFVALKNKLFDELRRNSYISDKQIDDYSSNTSENVENEYLLKEQTFFENGKVSYLLSKLSVRQREAVTLYYIEERKYEEICKIMDINYQSLRNLIHRSLTKLRSIACQ